MELTDAIDQYHMALDEFSRGDPAPVKAMYSRRDDAVLANPFVGPPVRGWERIAEALDFASSRFRDGEVTRFDAVVKYGGDDLAVIMEMESWTLKFSGKQDLDSFDLRVTTTFRQEGDDWKLIHRHADPIATPNSDGPLRTS